MRHLTETNRYELSELEVMRLLESESTSGLAAPELEDWLRQFGTNRMTARKRPGEGDYSLPARYRRCRAGNK